MKRIFNFTGIVFLVIVLSACGGGASSVSDNNESSNSIPLANAGANQNVATNSRVTLDASQSSDPDNEQITYLWKIESKPAGSLSELNDVTTPTPTFTPDVDGVYTISLVVNDGSANSAVDEITVTSSFINSAPVAHAGENQNRSIHNGTFPEVTLDGSSSTDADNDTLTYAWSVVNTPADSQISLSDSTALNPKFTPDLEGDYVFTLVVNDGLLSSEASTVVISCSIINSAPQAVIDTNQQTVFSLDEIQLSGSASTDDDSDPLTYLWHLQSLPDGSSANILGSSSMNASFVPDRYGEYVVSLNVNDGFEDSPQDSLTISVKTEEEKGKYLSDKTRTFTVRQLTTSVNDFVQAGSQYSYGITNNNTETLNWDRVEILDGNGDAITSSSDASLLGDDGALSPGESVTLSITLQRSQLLPLVVNYYLAESTDPGISFIKEHEL